MNDLIDGIIAIPTGSPVPNGEQDFAHASKAWDTSAGARDPAPDLKLVDRENAADERNTKGSATAHPKRVRDVLVGAQEVVQRNYRIASDTTDDFVHGNPWQAIAMASIGGLVIGMLMSR
jgi:ElaB/YqjD/DUF883 family membrane-anchored ribosome-binding protein